MPKLIFSQAEVNDIVKDRPEAYGPFYKLCQEKCEDMRVHADGIFPERLIRERRPNEPSEVLEYRAKIFKPITKPTFSKVYASLQKIRRSQDWSIRYENLDQFARVAEDETLEMYCEYNFPYFSSVTNWVFQLLLRKYLIDPNAVIFVYPITYEVAENEYLKPFPVIFESTNVLYFAPEDYAILKAPEGSTYYDSKGKLQRGRAYYFVTTQNIFRYEQFNGRGEFKLTQNYIHSLGILPVFKLKGVIIDQADSHFLYESRIAGMVPGLDEASREYSDLQAGVVTQLYAERWEYTQNECKACKGTGIRPNPKYTGPECGCEPQINCTATGCNQGYVVAGPYSKIMVRPPNSATEGQTPIPSPPAGYIEKDVEIIKLQDQRVKDHINDALAAINFEFLADTPLSQSGVAKSVDRDESSNTANAVAEDLVAIMDNVYRAIALYRYRVLYTPEQIEEMLPVIQVPTNFDLLSTGVLQKELVDSKNAKVNPALLSALEIDYAGKRFNSEPEVRDRLSLILTLDPLPNVTDEDKMTRLSNKGITLETYIISSNIQEFIQRAIDDNDKFVEMELAEQRAVLIKYAQEQITAATDALVPVDDGADPLNNLYGQVI